MVNRVPFHRHLALGSSMIEVLVTIVILVFGLLGMAGMQARLQNVEMEAYQRSQALLLLNDMANRIATNRNNAASYITTSALGAGTTCPTTNSTQVQRDAGEWCLALQGAAETTSSGANKVGAMVGGRGCVQKIGSDYMVTVAWQGLSPISAPPSSVSCGQDLYDGATGSSCVNDLCRRTVTTLVQIAAL